MVRLSPYQPRLLAVIHLAEMDRVEVVGEPLLLFQEQKGYGSAVVTY